MEQWQTILIVQGTAGKITLLARQNQQQIWEYHRSNDDAISSSPVIAYSFQEACSLLGQSWKYLTPQYIHPQFKREFWACISQEKGMFDRANWRKACM